MHRIASIVGILLTVLGPGLAEAQDVRPATAYVSWNATARPAEVAPGDTFSVVADVEIQAGWKMYALDSPAGFPVTFEWDEPPSGIVFLGQMRQGEPIEAHDPWFDEQVRYFSESARFTAPFRVGEDALPGPRTVAGSVRFMICNDSFCLPPTPVSVEAAVEVVRQTIGAAPDLGDAAAVPDLTGGDEPGARDLSGTEEGSRQGPPGSDDAGGPDLTGGGAANGAESDSIADLDAAREGGLWGFLLLAVGAGLAALLTPCVFPMIPLTVSYFTRHSANRAESVRMATVYGASIILTFTALGVLAALFVGAAGAQTIAANPWINLTIGLIFVVFALSLLGLFELRLPNGVLNYFNRQSSERSGYLGVLFMGLTLTLVSFSCTAPFVGGLLAATANDEWAYPVVGMAVFSATFSIPFILFALFPKALQALPRSGAWMNSVKVVLGFVELAAALKFFSNADLIWGWGLISRPVAIALAVVIFGLAGFYLLGKVRLRHEPPMESIGVVRLLAAAGFLGLSLYMLPGLFGAPLNAIDAYLPPRQATDVSLLSAVAGEPPAGAADLPWMDNVDEAFEQARAVNKPVFIDFTGYTCTNCRQMEADVFPREHISSRLERDYVLLRLYTDDREVGPELQRFQLRLTGTVALPTYAVVDPSGTKLLARTTGMSTPSEFAAFLERGVQAYRSQPLAVR